MSPTVTATKRLRENGKSVLVSSRPPLPRSRDRSIGPSGVVLGVAAVGGSDVESSPDGPERYLGDIDQSWRVG